MFIRRRPKKIFYIPAFFCAVLFMVCACRAETSYDDNFKQASDFNNYPGLTNLESAQLDVNLASCIHQENLLIIKILRDIESRLDKLESSVTALEKQANNSQYNNQ